MLYIILSFLTGFIIVITMMLNAKLAKEEGMINGVILNYFMATLSSLLLCIVMLRNIPTYTQLKSIPFPYFMGGFIGVFTTYLANVIVNKLSAIYVVILCFIGQIFTSAILDYIFLDIFSPGKIIGGFMLFLGLLWNAKVDEKYLAKEAVSESNLE